MYPTSISTGTNREERKAFIQSNLLNNDWMKFLIYYNNNLVGYGLLMPILMPSFLGSINIHNLYMKDKVIQKYASNFKQYRNKQRRKKSIHSVQLD